MIAIQAGGETLELRAERAVFWARASALLVADLHLGKAAAFGAAGIPVPAATARADLSRLASCLAHTGAGRLVILGDLLHARTGRDAATLDALAAWRRDHRSLDVLLVRGNHDDHAGDPPRDLGFRAVDEPHESGPFVLAHRPVEPARGYALAGHVHPAATLAGPAGLSARVPCFVVGARRAILPAFGSFTGSARFRPQPGDRIFLVAEDQVCQAAAAAPAGAGQRAVIPVPETPRPTCPARAPGRP